MYIYMENTSDHLVYKSKGWIIPLAVKEKNKWRCKRGTITDGK